MRDPVDMEGLFRFFTFTKKRELIKQVGWVERNDTHHHDPSGMTNDGNRFAQPILHFMAA